MDNNINHLKREIQYMINKKEPGLTVEKNKKIKELEKCLKKAKKESKEKGDYIVTIEKEKAINEYNENTKHINEYNRYEDGAVYPLFLFFHKDVVKDYGNIGNIGNSHTKDDEARRLWLSGKKDGGKLYHELYERLIERKIYNNKRLLRLNTKFTIDNFIKSWLTNAQECRYNDCIKDIEEYMKSKIKTKRIKEKYNKIIYELSILYFETNLKLYEYFTIEYNKDFNVNQYEKKVKNNKNKEDAIIIKEFENMINEYKKYKEEEENELKYVNNTIDNLKDESIKAYINNINNINNNVNNQSNITLKNPIQEGKYFKKWSTLTKEEKDERFQSFSKYYIEKNMIKEGILEEIDKNGMIQALTQTIIDANIKYKNMKWNIRNGIIESIENIKYDITSNKFYVNIESITNNEDKIIQKRKNKVKTIFTKENEKVINEEILNNVVNKQSNISITLENIKEKLKIKKITVNDQIAIEERYNKISNIISSTNVE